MESGYSISLEHSWFLTVWGAANCVASLALLVAIPRLRHLLELNLIWNAVTVLIGAALLNFLSIPVSGDSLSMLLLLLAGSLGLDIALYPLGGALLVAWGGSQASPRLRAWGYSLWFQGLVHIASSAIWLWRWLES